MANYYTSTSIGSPVFKHEPIPQFRPLNSLSQNFPPKFPPVVSAPSLSTATTAFSAAAGGSSSSSSFSSYPSLSPQPTIVPIPSSLLAPTDTLYSNNRSNNYLSNTINNDNSSSSSSAQQYLQSPSYYGGGGGRYGGGSLMEDPYYPQQQQRSVSSVSPPHRDNNNMYRNPTVVPSNNNILKSPSGVFSRTFTVSSGKNVLYDGELDIEGANDDEVVSQTLRQPKVLPPPHIAQGAGPVELAADDAYIREEEQNHQQQQQSSKNTSNSNNTANAGLRPTLRYPLRTSPRNKASTDAATKNTIIVKNSSGTATTSLSFVPSNNTSTIGKLNNNNSRKSIGGTNKNDPTAATNRRSKSPGTKGKTDINTMTTSLPPSLPPSIPTSTLLAEFQRRIQFNSEEFWEENSPIKPSNSMSSNNNTVSFALPPNYQKNSIASLLDKYKDVPSLPSSSSVPVVTSSLYPSTDTLASLPNAATTPSSSFTANMVSTLSPELSSAFLSQPTMQVDFNALREQAARLIPSATREVELEVASGKLFTRGEIGVQAEDTDIDGKKKYKDHSGFHEPVSKTSLPQRSLPTRSPPVDPYQQHSSSPSQFPSRYDNADNMNEASELLASPRPKLSQQPNNRNGLMSPLSKKKGNGSTTTTTMVNRRILPPPPVSTTNSMTKEEHAPVSTYATQHQQRRASISGTNGLGRFAQPTSSWERQHSSRESVTRDSATKPKPNPSASTNRSSSVPRQVSASVSKPTRNSSTNVAPIGRRASFSGISSNVPSKDNKNPPPRRASISSTTGGSITGSNVDNVRRTSNSGNVRNTSLSNGHIGTNNTASVVTNTSSNSTMKTDKAKATIDYLRNLLANSNKEGPGALVTLLERVANSEEQLSVMRYRSAYLENVIRTLTTQLQTREQQQQPLSSLTGQPIDTGSSSISMALVQGNGEATVESAMARLAAQLQTDVLENVLHEHNEEEENKKQSQQSSTEELLKAKMSPISSTFMPPNETVSTSFLTDRSYDNNGIPAPPPTPPAAIPLSSDNQVHVRDLIAKRMAKTKNDLVISANMMRETTAQGLFPTKTDSDNILAKQYDFVPSFATNAGNGTLNLPFSPRNTSNQFFSKLLDKTVIGATFLPLETTTNVSNHETYKPISSPILSTETKSGSGNTNNHSLLSTLFPSDELSKPVNLSGSSLSSLGGGIISPRQASQTYLQTMDTKTILTDPVNTKSSPTTSELVAQAHSLLQGGNGNSCSECERLASTKRCHECAEDFCDNCFDKLHSHGRRKEHLWTNINTASVASSTYPKINLPTASFSEVPTSSQFQQLLVQATSVKDALLKASPTVKTSPSTYGKRSSSDVITDSLNMISNGLSQYSDDVPTRVALLDHSSQENKDNNTKNDDDYTKDVHIVSKTKTVNSHGSTNNNNNNNNLPGSKPFLQNNKSKLPEYVNDPTSLLQRMYPNDNTPTVTSTTTTNKNNQGTSPLPPLLNHSSSSKSLSPTTNNTLLPILPPVEDLTIQEMENTIANRVEAQVQAFAQRVNATMMMPGPSVKDTAGSSSTITTTAGVPTTSSLLPPNEGRINDTSSFISSSSHAQQDPIRQARMRARAQQAQSKFISRFHTGNSTTNNPARLPWPNHE